MQSKKALKVAREVPTAIARKLTSSQLGRITAAETHALIGAFMLYLLSMYFPGGLLAVGVAYGGLFVVELWKEFRFDVATEQGATIMGGIIDMTLYYVGAALAFVFLVLTHKPL